MNGSNAMLTREHFDLFAGAMLDAAIEILGDTPDLDAVALRVRECREILDRKDEGPELAGGEYAWEERNDRHGVWCCVLKKCDLLLGNVRKHEIAGYVWNHQSLTCSTKATLAEVLRKIGELEVSK